MRGSGFWRKPLIGCGFLFLIVCALIRLYSTWLGPPQLFLNYSQQSIALEDRDCFRAIGAALRDKRPSRPTQTLMDLWEQLLPRASGNQLAFKESLGLWCERDHSWMLRKARWKRQRKRQRVSNDKRTAFYFYHNWEPDIGCALEERLGSSGDGGKWVCDPTAVVTRARRLRLDLGLSYQCVVYSFGSNNDFSFEMAAMQHLPDCEFFVFDPASQAPNDSFPVSFRRRVHFYQRALGPAESNHSLAQILSDMGHLQLPYVIEILKIDIESGEFPAFLGAFRAAERVRTQSWSWDVLSIDEQRALQTWAALRLANQILIEVHGHSVPTHELDEFFLGFQRAGFAIFHKEPNLAWCCGFCEEYGFLRLHDAFFEPGSTIPSQRLFPGRRRSPTLR
jgi:hypothetical protein